MDDIGYELGWQVHAMALAKQIRTDEPWGLSQALAGAILAAVIGAPQWRDPKLQRIRSWERMDALSARRRATREGLRSLSALRDASVRIGSSDPRAVSTPPSPHRCRGVVGRRARQTATLSQVMATTLKTLVVPENRRRVAHGSSLKTTPSMHNCATCSASKPNAQRALWKQIAMERKPSDSR